MQVTQWVLVILGVAVLMGFGLFGLVSLQEREKRAARVSFLLAGGSGAMFAVLVFAPSVLRVMALAGVSILLLTAVVLSSIPFGRAEFGDDTPKTRFDERDVIFSRFFRIQPGTKEFEQYYQMHPENQEADALTRKQPGLNRPGSLYYHPVLAAAVDGSFFLTENLSEAVDGPIGSERVGIKPFEITRFIKDLAYYYGALDVGITELQPYHVYSHIGRGPGNYGQPLEVDHRYAIALSVEMDHDMIGPNPALQGSMESARQYVEAARVAVQLAAFIRGLGYPARAHIDGNYRVICPLVARDAGLGEIGRMGLLMTPTHGPRVRLAAVTTDLDLMPDQRIPEPSVLDFCTICKKCAENCPSKSIPFEDRQETDGALRWKIDADTCFRYWMASGTDCGRCMKVCPYSHPQHPAHNLVRRAAYRSGLARRAVLILDDLFYGRNPDPRPVPPWTRISAE
jgi:ferredoxin